MERAASQARYRRVQNIEQGRCVHLSMILGKEFGGGRAAYSLKELIRDGKQREVSGGNEGGPCCIRCIVVRI